MFNKKVLIPCVSFIALCFVISGLSGWVTSHGLSDWFQTLNRSSISPPDWVFGPVWTVLYIMIGIAGGLLWVKRRQHPVALRWYLVQLLFNFAWSFIFFGAHQIGWALVDIVLLWVSILVTIFYAHRANKIAAYLLIPYFLWVSFACVLNISLFMLN